MGAAKKARVSWLLLVVVGLLGLLLASGLWLANSPVAAELLCRKLETRLTELLARPVRTASCNIDILPPAVEVSGLVAEPDSHGNGFDIKRLRVELGSLALLGGRLELAAVRVWQPRIRWSLAGMERTPEAATAGGRAVAAWELFPKLMQVEQGRVELELGGGRALWFDGIDLIARGSPPQDINGRLAVGRGELLLEGMPPLRLDGARVQAGWSDGRLRVEHLRLQAAGAQLVASGELATAGSGEPVLAEWLPAGWRPRLRMSTRIPLERLARFWPHPLWPRGDLQVQLRVAADESPPVVLELSAPELQVREGKSWSLAVRAELHDGNIELKRLQLDAAEQHVTASGRLGLSGEQPWQVEVELQRLALPELAAWWDRPELLAGACSGKLTAAGSLAGERHRSEIGGKFALTLDQLAWKVAAAGREWQGRLEAPRLRGRWQLGQEAVRWNDLRLTAGDAHLQSSGEYAWHRGWRWLQLAAEGIDLAAILRGLEPPLAGRLTTRLEYQEGQERRGQAELEVSELRLAERQLGHLRGSLRLEGDLLKIHNLGVHGPAGRLFINGRLSVVPPHALGLVVDMAEAQLADLQQLLPGVAGPAWLAGIVGGRVQVSGNLQRPVMQLQVAASQLTIGPQIIDEAGLVGRFEAGSWHLDLLEARLGPGWIYAQGDITPGLEINLSAYSTGLNQDSLPWLTRRLGLQCRLDLSIKVQGPLLAPVLQGWAKVYDSSLSGFALADSFISAQATAERVEVTGRFLGNHARLQASLENLPLLPFQARLDFAPLELSRLPPLAARRWLRVHSAGRITLQGKLLKPGESRGTLVLQGLRLQLADAHLRATSDWVIDLRGSTLELGDLQLAGRLAGVNLQGRLDLLQGPRLQALASLQLEQLLPRLPWLQRVRGRLVASLGLAGRWQDLLLRGEAQLEASDVKFADWPQPLERLAARARFSEEGLELQAINASAGGGRISGLGHIGFSGRGLDDVKCSFDLERVGSRIGSGMEAVVSGNLSLNKSRGRLLVLGGYLNVHQASYREKTTLVSLSQGLFRRRLLPSQAYDQEREVLGLDLHLSLPDTLQVDYDLGLIRYTATMGGQLHLTGSNERLGLLGELEASSGRVRYLTRDFEVSRAMLRFQDEYAIVPHFDLLAEHLETVERSEREGGTGEYRIKLRVQLEGEQQPLITLHSDPPLDERDIVTLLTLGVTSQDVETLKGEDLVGLGGEILTRSLALDEKLRRIFPFPSQVVQPKYLRVRSRYSTSARTQRGGSISPRLEMGARLNFLSPDLEMDYGRSLYDDADQNLDLTYRFSPAVSARLRWKNAEQDSPLANIGDLGLDLRLRWEW